MEKKEQLYEGKAKIIYQTEDESKYIAFFKDDATAFNGKKSGTIDSKGIFNNKISSKIFEEIGKKGIPTHYLETLSDREMLVKKVEIILVEVVIRNIVAGSMARRMGVEEGMELPNTIIDLHYKDDDLDDPLINEDTAIGFNLATKEELETMRKYALEINSFLKEFFSSKNIDLVDFKLEFGRSPSENNKIILADEITPDSCRFWEKGTGRKIDKDRFRHDLGNIEDAYAEIEKLVIE
tara:strand:+ start:3261 stop:3974 length:714 start_codon:yes stop_codon:yes gene_type:complete